MRRFSRSAHKTGLEPGTLKRPEPSPGAQTRFRVIEYGPEACSERQPPDAAGCLERASTAPTRWIDVEGVHDVATVETLGEHFALHPLLLEDVVTVAQRSKVEVYDDAVYIVVRMLRFDASERSVDSEQVSLVIAGDTLITFQEREGDVFEPIRERLRTGRPRLRAMGASYLAYALLDAVVDHYFVVLEELGALMEQVEDALVAEPSRETLTDIYHLKRELVYLRKSVWPLREAIGMMIRDRDLPFGDALHVFLRDLYDHTVHVIETIESYRDLSAGMLDTYLSLVSMRMNEVMKILTVIATVFIPITFLAGVYGMNFEHMPELHLRWTYPAFWIVCIVIALWMLRMFRRLRWF